MKIKICGIRRKEDVAYVNELRPDYAGFIFAKSKRQVSPYEAKELVGLLDKGIKKVGVFVNEDKKIIKQIAKDCSLDVLQLHGDEKPEFIIGFKEEVWKSFSIKDEKSLKNIDGYKDFNKMKAIIERVRETYG